MKSNWKNNDKSRTRALVIKNNWKIMINPSKSVSYEILLENNDEICARAVVMKNI